MKFKGSNTGNAQPELLNYRERKDYEYRELYNHDPCGWQLWSDSECTNSGGVHVSECVVDYTGFKS